MQLPLLWCLCSLFIFCLPISPYHVAEAVCLNTCVRRVKHERSDIVWPLKNHISKDLSFLVILWFWVITLNELPLQKLKMVGPWALSPSLKWQLQIQSFGIHAQSAHLHTQWQFLFHILISFCWDKIVKVHCCTIKLHWPHDSVSFDLP